MNGKKNVFGNESEALYDIPDTGIGVAWNYDAGLTNDATHIQRGPVTPKAIKPSASLRISRRRCLLDQKDSSKDDVAIFTAQLASLSTLQRKKAIRNSPNASPKNRSPRNLRLKTPVRSPLRKDSTPNPLLKDNFESLLNDSIDNEMMIRCTQAAEEACMKSPMLPRREGRNGSLKRAPSGRMVASPLSRKKLLNITSPRSHKPDVSPGRPTVKPDLTDTITTGANAAGTKTSSVKSADQYNNNVGSNFGFGEDDDIFMDFLDDCPALDQNFQSTKSKSLALKDRSNTTVTADQLDETKSTKSRCSSSVQIANNTRPSVLAESTRGLESKSPISSSKTSTLSSGFEDRKSSESVDPLDDSYGDFDLSPALLNLLDGNINGGNTFPKDVPLNGEVATKQSSTWASKPTMQTNGKPVAASTATITKHVIPVQTVKPTIQSSAKPTGVSNAGVPKLPVQTGRLSIQQSTKAACQPIVAAVKQPVAPIQTGRLSIQRNAKSNSFPTVSASKQPVIPMQSRQTGKPSVQPMVQSTTTSTVSVTRATVLQTGKVSIEQSVKSTSVSTVSVSTQPIASVQTGQSVQASVKPRSAPSREPARRCTPEEIERKRQEALQKLKRQSLRR